MKHHFQFALVILVVCSTNADAIFVYPETTPRSRPDPFDDLGGTVNVTSAERDRGAALGEVNGELEGNFGTGTFLISPNVEVGHLVLTAAHVVNHAFNWVDANLDETGQYYEGGLPALRIVHPDYEVATAYPFVSARDVALLLTIDPSDGNSFYGLAQDAPLTTGYILPGEEVGYIGYGAERSQRGRRLGYGTVGESVPDGYLKIPFDTEGAEGGDSGGPVVKLAFDGTPTREIYAVSVASDENATHTVAAIPVHAGSAFYNFAQGNDADGNSFIANISVNNAAGGLFLNSDVVESKVLNANKSNIQLTWSEGDGTFGYSAPRTVLGLLNDETLNLYRSEVDGGAGGAGASIGEGSSTCSTDQTHCPQSIIVGDSGTLNGPRGIIHVYSGHFTTSSLHNLGEVEMNFFPNNYFYAVASEIHITGPEGILNEGTFRGTRRVVFESSDAEFENVGIISPGNSPGTLTIAGTFTQSEAGTTNIEIGGGDPGVTYDLLAIEGHANLGGTINISTVDNFTPRLGDTFTCFTTSEGITGEFQKVNVTSLNNNLVWKVRYSANAMTFDVATATNLAGDFDLNGKVDTADYDTWKRSFGFTGSVASDGNRNGVVDAADYLIWRQHVGEQLIGDGSLATRSWSNPGGGVYMANNNWSGQLTPDADDSAVFDLGGGNYTVTSTQDLTVSRLLIGSDNINLNLRTNTMHLNADNFTDGFSQVLRVADQSGDVGSLHLVGGTISIRGLAVGATELGIGNTTGLLEITGPNTTLEIVGSFNENQIGGAGNDSGTLRVMAGGKLLADGASISLGRNGGAGSLLISGSDSEVDCSRLVVGLIGHGNASITNGGKLYVDSLAIANQVIAPSGNMQVDFGGLVHVTGLSIVGRVGIASLDISNGGLMHGEKQIQIASGPDATAQLTIHNGGTLITSKADSTTSSSGLIGFNSDTAHGTVVVTDGGSKWIQDGNLFVGSNGVGTLQILNHGYVECADSQAARFATAVADITVDGNGSLWAIQNRFVIGGAFAASGGNANVQVANGGRITAGHSLHIWNTGTLNVTGGGSVEIGAVATPALPGTVKVGADGVLSGSGHIVGDVLVDHGAVSPGASAGSLSITGNMTQLAGSTFQLEVAGPAAADYDRINVSGNMFVAGDIRIQFTNGYVPTLGTKYDLFAVGGVLDVSGANVQYAGGTAGLSFLQSVSGGIFSITAIPALLGDYDQNGTVNFYDYSSWRHQFAADASIYTGIDGNGNGTIDAADYIIWREHVGSFGQASQQIASVPEPGALFLLFACAVVASVTVRNTLKRR